MSLSSLPERSSPNYVTPQSANLSPLSIPRSPPPPFQSETPPYQNQLLTSPLQHFELTPSHTLATAQANLASELLPLPRSNNPAPTLRTIDALPIIADITS